MSLTTPYKFRQQYLISMNGVAFGCPPDGCTNRSQIGPDGCNLARDTDTSLFEPYLKIEGSRTHRQTNTQTHRQSHTPIHRTLDNVHLHFSLDTLHFSLYTFHFTVYTLHLSLHTFHFTLFTLYFTRYTSHFSLCT